MDGEDINRESGNASPPAKRAANSKPPEGRGGDEVVKAGRPKRSSKPTVDVESVAKCRTRRSGKQADGDAKRIGEYSSELLSPRLDVLHNIPCFVE